MAIDMTGLRTLATVTPTHEVVRNDDVVIGRGANVERLTEMAAWLTATAQDGATFEVRAKRRGKKPA